MKEKEILVIDTYDGFKDITSKVEQIISYPDSYRVYFKNGKKTYYQYRKERLEIFNNPIAIKDARIKTSKGILQHVTVAIKFGPYVKVFFSHDRCQLYLEKELTIEKNLLSDSNNKSIFAYFKEMAKQLTMQDILHMEKASDTPFLERLYKKIEFISDDSVLKYYLAKKKPSSPLEVPGYYIYPFRFNLSQQKAIHHAFENKISVIEGPPGTGKTQTILNIICNAILQQKTVAVLSNNNSATDNVYEKLEKEQLHFLAAKLGKKDNIDSFLNQQQTALPFSFSWALTKMEKEDIENYLLTAKARVETYLAKKNDIAALERELEQLSLEEKYFLDHLQHTALSPLSASFIPSFRADKLRYFLLYLNRQENIQPYFAKNIQYFSQLRFLFFKPKLFKHSIDEIMTTIEKAYYDRKKQELMATIKKEQDALVTLHLDKEFENYSKQSMRLMKGYLYDHYQTKHNYDKDTVKKTSAFIKDYPVILSTTYSLLNCIEPGFLFDYMIIDESSQVDLISSFPALSLAKNVIVVGDSKQLPHIVEQEKMELFDTIFKNYQINELYNYTKSSLLDLTKKLDTGIACTILREHYRCHPEIIQFCNQCFYDNQLIILSEEKNKHPIKQYKCVPGNHARKNENHSWFNERQIEVIAKEVIPNEHLDITHGSVGIIAPYKEQKYHLKKYFKNDHLAIDTVHGFQGREKNTIIFSTTTNEIKAFMDNPNAINVAVSRAIKHFYLVTPDHYKPAKNSNIINLIHYISYHNFEVVESKISSVFDLLYKVNEHKLEQFLKTHFHYSKYPSESLFFDVIKEELKKDKFQCFEVFQEPYPLRKLVRDIPLTEDEKRFINYNSHVDFLIFNKFNKQPVLAIEVDGYRFHSKAMQKIRDRLKNQILEKCQLPLLRFKTTGCEEANKLEEKLEQIINTMTTSS